MIICDRCESRTGGVLLTTIQLDRPTDTCKEQNLDEQRDLCFSCTHELKRLITNFLRPLDKVATKPAQ